MVSVCFFLLFDFNNCSCSELIFLETSAKTGDSVEEAFLKCSKTILAKIETGELDPEHIGSGIQYGDAAIRGLQKNTRPGSSRTRDCCKMWSKIKMLDLNTLNGKSLRL